MIPEHTKFQIDQYAHNYVPPGSFVHAVLSNDLMTAFQRADDMNLQHMKDIVSYLYNDVNMLCWGSPEVVEQWLKLGEIGKK